MAAVGSLTVDLIAQTASFNANIEKAARNLNSQAARMERSLASIEARGRRLGEGLGALRDVFLTYQVGKFIGEQFAYAASLGETAQQLGVTTKQLQVYSAMAGQVGIEQSDMETSLGKLTSTLGKAALGAQAPTKAFDALGISLRDSSGHVKTAGDVLPEIADKLAKVTDPAQRAAAEVALFGRSGQKLDNILTGGSKGIEDYTRQLESTGQILSDELINKADVAADRVEELNRQLKVNIAGVIAQNADAILGLANALATATGRAIQFINNYPRLTAALAGAAVGARLGGAPGAAIGGAIGVVGGQAMSRSTDDSNMNVAYRLKRLNEARANLERVRSGNQGSLFELHRGRGTAGGLKGATDEVRRQMGLLSQSRAQFAQSRAVPPPLPAGEDLPDFLASGGGGGGGGRKGGKAPKDRSADYLLQFQGDLARLDADLLQAKARNLADVNMIAELERQQLAIERGMVEKSIAADVTEGKLSQAQADQLLAKDALIRAEQTLTINTEQLAENSKQLLDVQMAANDNERDILSAQENLATTAAERRVIALKLLDMDKEEERLRLQHIIDMAKIGKATAAEAQAAEARLGQLGQIYGARRDNVERGTEGPLEAYLRDINKTDAEMNEAFQSVAVDGLNSLTDGITDAIVNFKSLGDVARSVLQQILADLLRLQIQKAIMGLVGNVLGGLGGGGGLSPVNFGAISDAAASVSIPGFANGTTGARGGWSIVGERGPELIPLAPGTPVIPNHRLPAFTARNDNSRALPPVTIHINGKMTEREARETGDQAYRSFRRAHAAMVRVAG